MTATELYSQIKRLPVAERLQLASLILNDLPKDQVVDVSEEWTEEDLEDFAAGAWNRADESIGAEHGE